MNSKYYCLDKSAFNLQYITHGNLLNLEKKGFMPSNMRN